MGLLALLAVQAAIWPLPATANYALGDPAPMCWKLDKSNTPIQCPPGLEAAWVPGFTIPSTIYVGVPVLVRMSLNVTQETFRYLETYDLVSKTSAMTAGDKWQQCSVANTPCPVGHQTADECCLYHVNGHSCQNKPGLFCGPWVGNDGHLATHTPAQTGKCGVGGRTTFDFLVKLFWEGSYTVIGHVKLGGFHFAIGATSEVKYGTAACRDVFQVPSRSGPCEDCRNGTQPLSQGIPPGARQIDDDEAVEKDLNPLCIACPPGWISPDGRFCKKCPSGTFAPDHGGTECTDCPAGRHAYDSGSSYCRTCLAGTYAPPGAQICSSCPRGRYRPNPSPEQIAGNSSTDVGDETDCLACPAPFSTMERHSTNVSDCVCPEGTYALPVRPGAVAISRCASCTEGMRCEVPALTTPLQAAGFQVVPIMSNAGRPTGWYQAHRCLRGHCLESLAGTCSAGRGGLACGECHQFFYPEGDGTCSECAGQDLVPASLGVAVLVILLCLLFIWAGADASRQRLSTLGLMCILGQVVVTMQLVSSISSMQFQLVDPLKSIVSTFRVLSLNVDSIKVQCVFGSDSPVLKYGMALASFPIFVITQALVFGLLKCITGRTLSPYDIANSLGLSLMVLFLPVTVICLQPFRCTSSPSGFSSVTTAASVLCGGSEHQAMLGIGAIGTLLYPITVLGAVSTVTFFYPRLVALGKSTEMLRCCRFLYQRFTPNRYYYSVVYLMRSAWVALLPVAFPEPGYYLPFGTTVAVACVALLQGVLWPWRTPLANINDLACGFFLIMVLAVSNALANLERELLIRQLTYILTICTAFGALTMLILILIASIKVFRYFRYKKYSLFLTHHKQGAGCLARLIKLRLQSRLRPEIFLDSDNLDDLESLFDTVRCDTAHLLAILTEETLRRPWCAGEIVTALKNKVPITIAAHASLRLPSEHELNSICDIWSPEELHPLHAVGVTEADICSTYRLLDDLPRITLPRMLACDYDMSMLDEALTQIVLVADGVEAAEGRRPSESSPPPARFSISLSGTVTDRRPLSPLQKPEKEADINRVYRCIVCNIVDPEASAAAFTLQHIMQKLSHDLPEVAFGAPCIEEATAGRGAVLIVVLTKGCLESPVFMRMILAAQGRWAGAVAIISVVADKSFTFPSKEDVAKSLSHTMTESLRRKCNMEVTPNQMTRCYTSVLQILALVFSSQLGMDILNTETSMIVKRVEKAEAHLQQQAMTGTKTGGIASIGHSASMRQKSSNNSGSRSSLVGNNWVRAMIHTISHALSQNSSALVKDNMTERAAGAPVSLLASEDDVETEMNFKDSSKAGRLHSYGTERSGASRDPQSSETAETKCPSGDSVVGLPMDWEPGEMAI